MEPEDFRNRKNFPGLVGGPFEIFVSVGEKIEALPKGLFLFLLLGLGLLPFWDRWQHGLLLSGLFLGDWALLALLPIAGRSYGPAKPPALMLAFLRLPAILLPWPWWLVGELVGTALVVYGFWIEPQTLKISYQSLQTPKLKIGSPLRVLHIGDIHMERMTSREHKVIEAARDLSPDLILFSGDLLSYSNIDDPLAWADVRMILASLSAPLGVYLVSGTPPVDREDVVQRILEGLAIHWLRDEAVTLDHDGNVVDLIGLSCTHKPFVDGPKLLAVRRRNSQPFTILLYHSPDIAPIAAKADIDLQLSGHTHGGQVRLPVIGALYTSSLYGKRYESGRYVIGDFTLYVTRGLGMEGKAAPRVRFLCPPEITLWEISR